MSAGPLFDRSSAIDRRQLLRSSYRRSRPPLYQRMSRAHSERIFRRGTHLCSGCKVRAADCLQNSGNKRCKCCVPNQNRLTSAAQRPVAAHCYVTLVAATMIALASMAQGQEKPGVGVSDLDVVQLTADRF